MDALGLGGGRGGADTASDIFSTVVRGLMIIHACSSTRADVPSAKQRGASSFIGTLPNSVKAFLAKYPPKTLAPDDVIISNDPWLGTGHLPDLTAVVPIFIGDELVGFAGAIAHMPDMGGRRRARQQGYLRRRSANPDFETV